MGEMADFNIEQGIDRMAMCHAGMCDGPCPDCDGEGDCGLIPDGEFAIRAIQMFRDNAGNAGVFAVKFRKLICEHEGHQFGPDMSDGPSICYKCDTLREDL